MFWRHTPGKPSRWDEPAVQFGNAPRTVAKPHLIGRRENPDMVWHQMLAKQMPPRTEARDARTKRMEFLGQSLVAIGEVAYSLLLLIAACAGLGLYMSYRQMRP